MSTAISQSWIRAMAIAGLAVVGALWIYEAPSAADDEELLGILDYRLLPEASGVAVSRRKDGRLWFVNDSGNRPELIALDLDDMDFSTVKLRKVSNRDWEDLESFVYDGDAWLAVADVGDNAASRNDVELYLLPEPKVGKDKAKVHTTIKVSYPDGPRDVESVAIDSVSKSIYLLSKRDPRPQLYRVPLPELVEGKTFSIVADLLGTVDSIPPPTGEELRRFFRYGKFRSQPTAMTMSPDGSRLAIMTYGRAYQATLGVDRDWLAALNGHLCAVTTPELPQGETIAMDSSNRLYVTTEGKAAKLFRLAGRCAK